MQNTTNYNLKKPDVDDFYNIQDFNDNADIMDAKIKELVDGKSNTNHTHNYAGSSTPGGAATSATTSLACTGNSATATKLATSRTLNGIAFDGSTNLSNYASTGGTSTAYTVSITGASYVNGLEITILPHTDCGANATLNVNSLGALTIKNSSGETLKAGDIKAGVPVSLVRVGSYFFIRGGGGKTKPNIFVQSTEPTSKDGIWIKSSGSYDGVIELADQAYFDGSAGYIADYSMAFNFYGGSAVVIGTDIYLFGTDGINGGAYDYQLAYKLNASTSWTLTRLTNIPCAFTGGIAIAVNDSTIYLFVKKQIYKYNVTNGTYECVQTDGALNVDGARAVLYNGYIYLFDGAFVYKYNISTNSYTQLANMPDSLDHGSAALVGDYVYIFGTNNNGHFKYAYKYSISANSYTTLADIPTGFAYGSVAVIGTDVYLFGAVLYSDGTGCRKAAYKYNTTSGTYTRLTDMPGLSVYGFRGGCAVSINDYIHLLGGQEVPTYHYKYGAFKFSPNKIIFKANPYPSAYAVNLFKTDYSVINNFNKFKFDNVFLTGSDGKNTNALCYYGTGSAWVQI